MLSKKQVRVLASSQSVINFMGIHFKHMLYPNYLPGILNTKMEKVYYLFFSSIIKQLLFLYLVYLLMKRVMKSWSFKWHETIDVHEKYAIECDFIYALSRIRILCMSINLKVRLLVTLRQKLVPEDTLKTTTSEKIPRTAKRLSGRFFEVELQKLKQQDGVELLKAYCRKPLQVCWYKKFSLIQKCLVSFNLNILHIDKISSYTRKVTYFAALLSLMKEIDVLIYWCYQVYILNQNLEILEILAL